MQEALRLLKRPARMTRDLALAGSAEVYELYRSGGIVSTELYAFLSRDLAGRGSRRSIHACASAWRPASALPAWEYIQRKDRYAALGARRRAPRSKVSTRWSARPSRSRRRR